MKEIIIYTKPNCPYCVKAKNLLLMKKISDIREIDISDSEKLREEMIEKSFGRRTVPQIFIYGQHIGGFDDMKLLSDKGQLDEILAKNN